MALSSSLVSLGIVVAIYGLLALGLNVKFGFTGLLDIGHVAFYLTGAYVTALLVLPPASTQPFATYILGWQWPWLPALAAGTIAAGVLGMLVALPAIRLREDYLAIAVLGISVILKRIVKNEGWLGNGPGTLRGFQQPFRGLFPLPDAALAPALLFGVVILVVWAVATYLLADTGKLGFRGSLGHKIANGLLAVTSLGVSYLAARRARQPDGSVDERYVAAAGLVVGVVAFAGSLAGLGQTVAFALLGAMSLFSWTYGAAAVSRYYEQLDARDSLLGLGLAVGFVVALVPLVALGSSGMFPTVALLAVYLYGVYRLGSGWESVGSDTKFVRVVGVAAVWLFAIRYFVMANITPFQYGGVGAVVANTVQNLLWLLKFEGSSAILDYSRFLLVATVGVVAVAYYLTEVTVRSPFGRVLKAIREDEDVATALGKNTFAYKVQSMILGSALAGLAGGLTAIYYQSLVHTMFAPRITFIAFLIVIIGGTANNKGVLLGAVIYWAFQKGTADIAGFVATGNRSAVLALRLAFIGALLIVILYYRPEGLWGEERTATAEVAD